MMEVEILDGRRQASGGYRVDISRGERVGRVSSEWFSRPDDERFLSLSELYASVKGRAERSRTRTVESAAIRVEAHREDSERLALVLPDAEAPAAPTHWSFGQLASLVSAPAAYLRQLPAPLARINLQYGLTAHRAEQVKTLETEDGRTELRAVTGPDHGRIYDHELVAAVQRIAGDGVGEGIFTLERIFGTTITASTGREVPVRLVGEQHVIEDLGFIPSFADWVRCIQPEPWMGQAQPIHRSVGLSAAEPAGPARPIAQRQARGGEPAIGDPGRSGDI